jgi:hypothetical protein
MKRFQRTLGLALVAAIPAACGSGPAAESRTAGAEETHPAADLPTQAEADAQAEQRITPENADLEFEKLKREIEGD